MDTLSKGGGNQGGNQAEGRESVKGWAGEEECAERASQTTEQAPNTGLTETTQYLMYAPQSEANLEM